MRVLVVAALAMACITVGFGATTAAAEVTSVATVDAFKAAAWGRDASALVLFTASWSKKACEPALQAMRDLDTHHTLDKYGPFRLVHIDVGKLREVAKNYSVGTFPTFMLFAHVHSARVSIYNGHSKAASDIAAFIESTLSRHDNYKAAEATVERHRLATLNNHPHPDPGQVVDISSVKEFDRIVGDSAKTVLVVFTAPWCQYCKDLKPILNELADFFKGDHKTVIVNVNADLVPEVPQKFNVQGFPTIRMFPKGVHAKGKGILYKGERSLHALSNFLDVHNKNKPVAGVDYPFDIEDDFDM